MPNASDGVVWCTSLISTLGVSYCLACQIHPCRHLLVCLFIFQQVDEPASGSQDGALVSQESSSITGDSTKLLDGEDYWLELTKALHRRGVVDQDACDSSAVKERDNLWHSLEKEWKAISTRIERDETKPKPSSQHSSVSCCLCFYFARFCPLLWVSLSPSVILNTLSLSCFLCPLIWSWGRGGRNSVLEKRTKCVCTLAGENPWIHSRPVVSTFYFE